VNFYKRYKLAFRGNIPKIEDPGAFKEPYRKRSPEDGQGPKLTTLGDEDTGSSVGGDRGRGVTFPETSPREDYTAQREKDIPHQDYMFMGFGNEKDSGEAPMGEGVGAGDPKQTFVDYRDKPVDIIGREPVGPHNMQKYRTVSDRTRKGLRGI